MTTAETNITYVNQFLMSLTKVSDSVHNNVIQIIPETGYTKIAAYKEFSVENNAYFQNDIKPPYKTIYSEADGIGQTKKSYDELYYDSVTGKYHPVYYVNHDYKFTTPSTAFGSITFGQTLTGPVRVLDIDEILRVKKSQETTLCTCKLGDYVDLGKDGNSIKRIIISCSSYYKELALTAPAQMSFQISCIKTSDLPTSDPTHYVLPEYIIYKAVVKVADLGQEVTL